MMHVVVAGSGEVSRNGRVVTQVGPGQYFGELALIDDGPRTADVVAGLDGLETFALTKWTFNDLLVDHPEVAIPMLRVLAARLRRCEAEPAAPGVADRRSADAGDRAPGWGWHRARVQDRRERLDPVDQPRAGAHDEPVGVDGPDRDARQPVHDRRAWCTAAARWKPQGATTTRSGRASASAVQDVPTDRVPGARPTGSPTGGGHQVGDPVPGAERRVDPLDDEHPRPGAAGDAAATAARRARRPATSAAAASSPRCAADRAGSWPAPRRASAGRGSGRRRRSRAGPGPRSTWPAGSAQTRHRSWVRIRSGARPASAVGVQDRQAGAGRGLLATLPSISPGGRPTVSGAVTTTAFSALARGGSSHSPVTPTSWSSSPRAYTISVADGSSETIRTQATVRSLGWAPDRAGRCEEAHVTGYIAVIAHLRSHSYGETGLIMSILSDPTTPTATRAGLAAGARVGPAQGRGRAPAASCSRPTARSTRIAHDPTVAAVLVQEVVAGVEALAPELPHDAGYLRAVVADLRRWADGGFAVPDFLDSLLAFRPELAREDGLRAPRALPDVHPEREPRPQPGGGPAPGGLAVLGRRDRGRAVPNPMFVPVAFEDFTSGYDTNSAVLFPETVAVREVPAFTLGRHLLRPRGGPVPSRSSRPPSRRRGSTCRPTPSCC